MLIVSLKLRIVSKSAKFIKQFIEVWSRNLMFNLYKVKPVYLKRPLKRRQKWVFKTDNRLMQVKSIA